MQIYVHTPANWRALLKMFVWLNCGGANKVMNAAMSSSVKWDLGASIDFRAEINTMEVIKYIYRVVCST